MPGPKRDDTVVDAAFKDTLAKIGTAIKPVQIIAAAAPATA